MPQGHQTTQKGALQTLDTLTLNKNHVPFSRLSHRGIDKAWNCPLLSRREGASLNVNLVFAESPSAQSG